MKTLLLHLALTLSLTAVASADPISGTVSETSGPAPISTEEPIIKPEEVVLVPTPMIEIAERTYFYNAPNGEKLGALAPQKSTQPAIERVSCLAGMG